MPKSTWPPERPSQKARRLARGELRKEEWAATPAWRVGKTASRLIYRGDTLIGVMDSASDAELVVKAVNKFYSSED